MPRLVDWVVGELANSLVPPSSLLTARSEADRAGHPLGQLLVQRRLLTTQQLLELLRAAEQAPLGCSRCGARHAYTSLDPQSEAACPLCAGPLLLLAESQRRPLHRTLALTQPDTRADTPEETPYGTGQFPAGTGQFPGGMGLPPSPPPSSRLIQPPRSGRIPASAASGSRRFAGVASGRKLGEDGVVEEFGPYQLLEELGRGGMGVVYKARQPGLDRFVALKVLLGGELASETQVKRFQREAEIAARLKHPAIVQIHDVGVIGDHHYLTMDFVDGTPLSKLIKRRKLSIGRAATVVRDIARGLEHADKKGVIHRDIKPANIIVEKEGSPVITDFGLARDEDPTAMAQLTRDGAMVGTPFYMSPEQASGKRESLSGKSDVFALGVVLFELVCHELPFHAETHIELSSRIINEEPPRPRELRPDLDLDLETIVLKALEKSPHRRYSAGELADDLDRYLQGQPILARPQTVLSRLTRKMVKNKRLAAVVLGSLLAVGATAFLVVDRILRLAATAPPVEVSTETPTPNPVASPTASPAASEAQVAAQAAVRKATEALDRARRTPAGAEYRFALEEAIRRLTDALALEPNRDDPALLVQRGHAYLRLHKHRPAVQDLERVLARDPPSPPRPAFEAAFRLARHKLRSGEKEACAAVLQRQMTRPSPPAADTEANAWRNLLAAFQALHGGKPDEARSLAARARELNPLLAEAHYEEGLLQALTGRVDEARRSLLKSVEIDPKDPYTWAHLAQLHMTVDPRRGASDLERALELDPELDIALEQRAGLRQMEGRTTDAISDLRRVLRARPEDPDVLYSLALLYDSNKQSNQAQKMLQRLEQVAPSDPRPYRHRSRQYLLEGEFSIALQQLARGIKALAKVAQGSRAHRQLVDQWEQLATSTNSIAAIDRYADARLKRNANDGDALALKARARFQLDRDDEAKALLQEARRRDPRSLEALELHLLMMVRVAKSPDRPKIVRELERFAVKVDPQDARALAHLSRLYAVLAEDMTKADAYARRARRLDPSLALPLVILGNVSLKRERMAEAHKYLRLALDCDPYNDEALQMLGVLFFNNRKLKLAERYLRMACQVDPMRESPLEGLGLVLLRTKRMRECYALSRQYVGLCLKAGRMPGPGVVSNLTRCQIDLGEEEAALKLIAELKRKFPKIDTYEMLRAEIYMRLGQIETAKQIATELCKKAPDRPDFKAFLRQLERRR